MPSDAVETGAPLTTLTAGPHHHHLPHASSSKGALTFVPDSQGKIAFFRQDSPNYALSNSLAHPVYFNNLRYPTAEHLFQALKFIHAHPDLAAKIRRARTPLDAIRIARENTQLLPPGWISDGLNVRVMHKVVLAKFAQDERLQDALLRTEDREIVDETPTNVFWAVGAEGRGRNVLGKIIMAVRDIIRATEGVTYGSAAKTM